jgi:putative flippase GtrA
MRLVIKYFFTRQFLLFLGVGGLAAFLHWLSRILLSQWLSFNWAVTVAYGIGILVAFLLNSFLVFPKSTKPKKQQAREFFITNICFFPVVWISAIEIYSILQYYGVIRNTEEIAHAIAVGIPMFATFLIYKFIAFKDTKNGQ